VPRTCMSRNDRPGVPYKASASCGKKPFRCERNSTFYLNRQPTCFALMYTTRKLEKHSGVSEEMRGCNDGRVYGRETGELPADEASWARGLCRCVPGRTHLSPDGRGH